MKGQLGQGDNYEASSSQRFYVHAKLRTMTIRGIVNYHTCLTAKSSLRISTCAKSCQMLHIT